MALIVYNNQRTSEILDLPFNLNYKDYPAILKSVEYIQADGEELEYILRKFTIINGTLNSILIPMCTIPMTTNKTMYWYGDLARTILLNL